ncbi:MAG: hypothetical protein NVSMB51_22360 [Solirubrobacteraceae bacterium]
MADRTPEEIRASIEANRHALVRSVDQLRGEITHFTDWRGQIRRNQRAVLGGAAVAGFVLAGGVAAFGGLFRRRR